MRDRKNTTRRGDSIRRKKKNKEVSSIEEDAPNWGRAYNTVVSSDGFFMWESRVNKVAMLRDVL